jgi:hypothetical protein
MRTSFHHQPEAQHPNFQLPTSWQADYPIFRGKATESSLRSATLETSGQAVIQASKLELRIMRYELTGHYRR